MAEPGTASNAIPQINPNGLPSLNSYSSFLPIGGDGPSIVYDGRATGGLGSINPLSSSVVPNAENGTRKVRGEDVEEEKSFDTLTDIAKHKAFQESPYVHYVQKPGSDGEIFTPFMKPVQTHDLGRGIPLEQIRYHSYHLLTEKPPTSWRLGLSESDKVTAIVEKKIHYRDIAPIRFN
jgi:hypothetical protein